MAKAFFIVDKSFGNKRGECDMTFSLNEQFKFTKETQRCRY